MGRTRNPISRLWLQHTSRIYHIPLPFVSKFFSVTYCMNPILRGSSDILCNKYNDIRLYEDQNMSATHREALRAACDTRVVFDRFALQRKRWLQSNQQLFGHIRVYEEHYCRTYPGLCRYTYCSRRLNSDQSFTTVPFIIIRDMPSEMWEQGLKPSRFQLFVVYFAKPSASPVLYWCETWGSCIKEQTYA